MATDRGHHDYPRLATDDTSSSSVRGGGDNDGNNTLLLQSCHHQHDNTTTSSMSTQPVVAGGGGGSGGGSGGGYGLLRDNRKNTGTYDGTNPAGIPTTSLSSLLDDSTVNDFILGKTLGTGSFGRVRFVTDKNSGRHYALKILKKAAIIKLKQVDHIISEKSILKVIHHPNIVNLYGSFQDKRYLYLAMEAGRFTNEISRFYAAQIVSIFEYLHNKDIIYRDLKPENILLTPDGYLKLTDFGFAKVIHHTRTYTLCGTPEYIAPEVLLNKGHGKAVDWWTLGILTYEMIVGYPPFVDEDPMGIYQKILSGKIVFPRYFDKDAKSLVKRLLTADLTKRYGNLRNGVDDIKGSDWFKGLSWYDLYNKNIPAPYKPKVKSDTDTSNFDDYPDSTDGLPAAIPPEQDPFLNW
ncbi:hypothetical protein FOZ63_004025 [Perkinsus olseni]|uniref:Uncharacterized protein n=1 Tax=Perkinsus olseni TaxID=32597 RepID=A0A7J6T0N6_PEROL|nr:hypothetical protein FOZ63_004025 [Perkinsus olseni]